MDVEVVVGVEERGGGDSGLKLAILCSVSVKYKLPFLINGTASCFLPFLSPTVKVTGLQILGLL